MTNDESAIINSDSALPIPRQIARWIGWNEAGILQQLHYHTLEEHGQVVGGIRWIRMSETEWMDEIPLDEKAIQRAIKNLIEDGLIISAVFKGRCKWYAVCYEAVEALNGPVERIAQKSEKRKAARNARQDLPVKEQNVPIGPNNEVKVQNVPKGQNVPIEWVQNVPLQDSSRLSSILLFSDDVKEQNVPIPKDGVLEAISADNSTRQVCDKIDKLVRTNFFNPTYEPYRTNLIRTVTEFTPTKVLWAIELALSPEKANGKPKTWGFVLGILQRDRDSAGNAPKNEGTNNGQRTYGHRQTYKNKQNGRPLDPRAMDTTGIEREIAELERKLGAGPDGPNLSPV